MYSLLQLFLTAFQLRLLLWLVVLVTTVGWGCCAAGALDGSIPETATAREEVELGGGVVYHPNAPPPSRDPIPPNSTQLSLLFDEGVWVVVVENDISDLEMRALLDGVCEEAGAKDPLQAAAFAANWKSLQNGYERTEWWFETSGARDVFHTYLAHLVVSAADRPVSVLEIGSFEGASALWFATHLLLHPDSILVCLDTWEGGAEFAGHDIDMPAVEHRFKKNIAKAPNNERVNTVKGDSMISLAALVAGGASSTFDVIYVDGSHTMANALSDGLLSFRLLKVGGFLIFDDLNSFGTVDRATVAFVEALDGEDRLEVLYRQNQLVIRKTAEDRWATSSSVVTMGTTLVRTPSSLRAPTETAL